LLIIALIRNRDEQIGPISALTVALTMIAAGVLVYFISAIRRKRMRGTQEPTAATE
jgi:hypothetical protein